MSIYTIEIVIKLHPIFGIWLKTVDLIFKINITRHLSTVKNILMKTLYQCLVCSQVLHQHDFDTDDQVLFEVIDWIVNRICFHY